jgi:hypothetical protein
MPRISTQLKQNDNKKIEHLDKVKERNARLKPVLIICPYCSTTTNLLNIKTHLKSKRCQHFKALFFENATDDKEIKTECAFNKYINECTAKVRAGEPIEPITEMEKTEEPPKERYFTGYNDGLKFV